MSASKMGDIRKIFVSISTGSSDMDRRRFFIVMVNLREELANQNDRGGAKSVMANKRLHPVSIQIERGGNNELTKVECESLSPVVRMLHAPNLNVCIIAVMAPKTTFDVDVVKRGLENTLI
ncbi:hypothetical protein POM88_047132 [Heracleum sosnowskyi]|uniref:Uncharacterized protein n=1 Tax=Heracleum sosnowskyi TaxID=360622 RepID=A0AAD8M854_9APIA|nr:hypothetical protein POM88_047132 [Heracleum sosnowskyi]